MCVLTCWVGLYLLLFWFGRICCVWTPITSNFIVHDCIVLNNRASTMQSKQLALTRVDVSIVLLSAKFLSRLALLCMYCPTGLINFPDKYRPSLIFAHVAVPPAKYWNWDLGKYTHTHTNRKTESSLSVWWNRDWRWAENKCYEEHCILIPESTSGMTYLDFSR